MRSWMIAAGVVAVAASCIPTATAGEDKQAGTTLTPAEAAGAWTIQADDRDLRVPTLSPVHRRSGSHVQLRRGA